MTMRSYDDDEFRPWYIRDTRRYLQLSLEARGLIAELLRKWDHHGRLVLSADPVADLAFLLRIDEEMTRRAFRELTEPSKAYPVPRLQWDPSTSTLSDPDFLDRERRGKGAKRMAKKRQLDAEKAAKESAQSSANDSTPPTPEASQASQGVTSVTQRHNPSPSGLVWSGLSEIRSEDPDSSPRADDDPTPWSEGTGGMAARDRFIAAVSSATGGPFVLDRAGWHQSSLCDLLNAYAKGRPKPVMLDWLERAVREWVAAEKGKSAAGWEPRALVRWVNGGRKSYADPKPRDQGGGASAAARRVRTGTDHE